MNSFNINNNDMSIVFNGKTITDIPEDLFIPPEALRVIIEQFEGPLDLLLYLIKKQNIDVVDIPILPITNQYVEYINMMQEMQFELASDYLVMASTLAEIKSRMLVPNETEDEDEEDLESAPLYMYYVSLENDKMLLHVDFKQDVDVVLTNCTKLYEFARINAPRKVVYTTEVKDLYDVDKDVKLFMNVFGIENTRGGSYTDVELPDFLTMTILHEKKITDVHFYINRKV